MDVSIVGAWGAVGRATAIALIQGRILDASSRLQLVGRRGGEAERALVGFASDLQDAFAETIPELDLAFDEEDVLGDILVVAAGATMPTEPRHMVPRRELAAVNRPMFERYADVLRRRGHGEELVLVVSNPVELGVAIFSEVHPRQRVIGMGGHIDTLRFRRELASELGIRRQMVQGLVLGEHGLHMVPCWSTVSAFGFDSAEGRERIAALRRDDAPSRAQGFGEVQRRAIEEGSASAFAYVGHQPADLRTYLKPFASHVCGAKTTVATAETIAQLVQIILSGNQTRTAAQVRLSGEFLDIHGVTGVPVVVSHLGARVEPIPLWDSEIFAVREAAAQAALLIR